MPVTVPYDWIRELPRAFLEHEGVPLFGHSPPFPWATFQKALNQLFQMEGIQLHPLPPEWRTAEEIATGIDFPLPFYFNIEPIGGTVVWLLSSKDISLLAAWFLTQTTSPLETMQDPSFTEGFYNFLAVQCCHLVSTSGFDAALTPKLVQEGTLPSNSSLCIDIGIAYKEQEIRGRLILPSSFYQSWKKFYSNRTTSIAFPQSLANQLELTVSMEAGRVELTKSELADAAPGDCILLDFCSVKLTDNKEPAGRVIIAANGIPLFRGKLKQGKIKILELPLFYEAHTPMDSQNYSNEKEDDDFAPRELTEEDQDQIEASFESVEEPSMDESLQEESQSPSEEDSSALSSLGAKKVDLEEIPLMLKIEVGRLRMSVKKLLELQPGNTLELNVRPEDGVDLFINDKCIGKGELIRFGEALGVRILDLQ